MPRDASGNMSRVHGWQADAVAEIGITPARFDAEHDDFALEIQDSVSRSGKGSAAANLPMAGHRHTNVGDATARNQYATAGQVQDGGLLWGGTAGGTANALTINTTPALTANAAGRTLRFFAGPSTNTDAVTLKVGALDPAPLRDAAGTALPAGFIAAGALIEATFDGSVWRISSLGRALGQGLEVADGLLKVKREGTSLRLSSAGLSAQVPTSARTSGFTVGNDVLDRGKLFLCNGTFTVAIRAVAELAASFFFFVKNTGSGVVTIDPAGAETIDGATTLVVPAGHSCRVVSDGAAWHSSIVTLPPLASQAQAEAGTDNAALMTPLRDAQAAAVLVPQLMVAAQSLVAAGYVRFASGLVVQWDTIAGAGSAQTATFPIAFPTACFGVHLTRIINDAPGETRAEWVRTISTTQVAIHRNRGTGGSTTDDPIFYLAIGH